MLDACLDPEMASEITLQPVRRHGVDAGIFFSDIVVPIKLAGVDVEIVPGRGPVLSSPIRTPADVDALEQLDPAALAPIEQAVRRTVEQLGDTPLIGFAGAPFTLAAYLVEGGPSKDHIRARTLMHADPETWSRLLAWAAEVSGMFLRPGARRGLGRAALRLVGRVALPRRLRPVRRTALRPGDVARRRASGCRASTSASAAARSWPT